MLYNGARLDSCASFFQADEILNLIRNRKLNENPLNLMFFATLFFSKRKVISQANLLFYKTEYFKNYISILF
jgi:hypothetical protein